MLSAVDAAPDNSAYLVDLGDGRALAVDPSRELRALRAAAARHGLSVAFAANTHLHADFLSGAHQLAAEGTTVLASAAGRRPFPHCGLADGDDADLGGLSLRALATPGHTEEHLAYVLLDGSKPLGVFTGGSLIVGVAAPTDLVDPARTEELARAQYRSVGRLLELLPDDAHPLSDALRRLLLRPPHPEASAPRPAPCRSSCGTPSQPGWAGSPTWTARSSSSGTPTRTRRRSSGRP